MKNFLPLLSVLVLSVSFSCGNDSEKDNGPGFEFIDQEATGEIIILSGRMKMVMLNSRMMDREILSFSYA